MDIVIVFLKQHAWKSIRNNNLMKFFFNFLILLNIFIESVNDGKKT